VPWTEAQVDELIASVQRDFALKRAKPEFWLKLHSRGISSDLAEKAMSKKSYIIQYEHGGLRIGFFDPTSKVFVGWRPEYPTELKTCFLADGGLSYLKRQYDWQFIWTPR
jgi:hypothetical protein